MASKTGEGTCCKCGKQRTLYTCNGCLQYFCIDDLLAHRQLLEQQFDKLQNDCNDFCQKLNEYHEHIEKHSLIQQVDNWEEESIRKIKETAEQCRRILQKHLINHTMETSNQLVQLTNKKKQYCSEDNVNEIKLNQLKLRLKELADEFDQPSHILLRKDSALFINKIWASVPLTNANWSQNGVTVAGGNGKGVGINQLDRPWGVCVDEDQTVYVADHWNARIMQWKLNATNGAVVADNNNAGYRTDQLRGPIDVIIDKETGDLIVSFCASQQVLKWPRQGNKKVGKTLFQNICCSGLAMDDQGFLYVADNKGNEVRRYRMGETKGTKVAGGNGEGDALNQLNKPSYVFVDRDYSVYVSDCGNHRVMKWVKGATDGIVVAGGRGNGNSLDHLSFPYGIFVDSFEAVYVTEGGNDRVTRWHKGITQGELIIGGNGRGEGENQLNDPTGLCFDWYGHLYVADCNNHRVQCYSIEQT